MYQSIWSRTPPDILELIADFADIDSRRSLGFAPRKLDAKWLEFVPKTIGTEDHRYYINEMKMTYYEFWEYGSMYHESISDVLPNTDGSWKCQPGSVTRMIMCHGNITEEHESDSYDGDFHMAGEPIRIKRIASDEL
jgi:hypothetical protein